MQIQHNISAISASRNLAINNSALKKNLEKLSSGYRINRAGDDAAGLAISEQMRAQINGLDQAATNAQDAIGMIQTAEGALTEVHAMLQRMVTLATQASTETTNKTAIDNINQEITALTTEIKRIGSNTDFNGMKPLNLASDGSKKFRFQIGPTKAESISVEATKLETLLSGSLAIQFNQTNHASNSDFISTINGNINELSKYRAKLGAAQNRLEHTVNSLKVTSENIQEAESRIRDTNMPDEITSFTKNNILLQSAQSMLAQANSVPQSVLSLLQ